MLKDEFCNYSGTSHNKHSEIRITSVATKDRQRARIDSAIEIIYFQPPRYQQSLINRKHTAKGQQNSLWEQKGRKPHPQNLGIIIVLCLLVFSGLQESPIVDFSPIISSVLLYGVWLTTIMCNIVFAKFNCHNIFVLWCLLARIYHYWCYLALLLQ